MNDVDKRPYRADGGDISTGRLKEIADNPYGDEEKCWLAKRVLASLEAEAVAWTDEQELRDVEKFGCAYLFTVNPITPNADPRRVIKLYTAPPAPVVPKEINVLQAANLVLVLGVLDNGIPTVAMKVWNACRAAMIQGVENTESRCTMQPASALDSLPQNADSRCSNSPVFPDGWVMVPVEPTEEMLAELCLVKGWTARALNTRYQAMLAAAPKPEA
ncbi:hypothetical protein ACTLMW_001828 [Enterobacter roggenkampii]